MTFKEINIRDPFVLPFDGKYYLYGTRGETAWTTAQGLDVYVSDDLENWSEAHECFSVPKGFWANKENSNEIPAAITNAINRKIDFCSA